MDWKKYLENIKEFYERLDSRQRVLLMIGTGITLTVFILLTSLATRTSYGVLYTELDAAEAGTIVQKLKEENVEFKLENGGSTILVSKSEIYDLRLQLAAQGLPQSGGIGYELFDKNNIGMTDFLQKMNYKRALEGELARTITTISKIKAARVHLVIPEERLFDENQKEATASITTKLKPGLRLSQSETNAIANLVAASVEGLSPDNITIVDTYGKILSQPQESTSLLAKTSNQIDLQNKIEQYYKNKVESILENVIGSNRAAVQVSVELNFDQVERTAEKYDPDNSVIVSQEKNTQTGEGGNGKIPQKTESLISNYESNKVVEHIVQEVGNIKRLSVAVLVDGKYEVPPGSPEGTEPQYLPMSVTELTQIQNIVKNTVGYSEVRQDNVVVENMAFDRSLITLEAESLSKMERQLFWETWITRLIYGCLLILIAFGLKKFFKQFKSIFNSKSSNSPLFALESPAPAGDPFDLEISADSANSARLQQTISNLTKEQPTDAAKLLKAWLIEDKHGAA